MFEPARTRHLIAEPISGFGRQEIGTSGMQNEPGRLDKFFRPNVVAVVGASARQQTRGNIVIRNLQQWKFPGRIIPVHPSAAEIEGLATVRSIDDLPSQTDVAFLSVAAEGL